MEYKKTLNMSKSGFPMRGGLPMREIGRASCRERV